MIEAKASHSSEEIEEDTISRDWKGGGTINGSQVITQSPSNSVPQMANIGKVKFQPPNVPVILLLKKLYACVTLSFLIFRFQVIFILGVLA